MDRPAPDTATRRADPSRVEAYVEALFAREDRRLEGFRDAMARLDLPTIQVPPATGKFLQVVLRASGARRVLEVGTLGGYSAMWMVRGLPPEGRLLTVERDPQRAALARRLLADAGESHRVEVLEGDARVLLPGLGPEGSFDALFLDADKSSLPIYLGEAARLLRPGGLLLVDNALWRGAVLDSGAGDDDTEALREVTREVASSPDWTGTIVPVGDGVLLAVRS